MICRQVAIDLNTQTSICKVKDTRAGVRLESDGYPSVSVWIPAMMYMARRVAPHW